MSKLYDYPKTILSQQSNFINLTIYEKDYNQKYDHIRLKMFV